MEIRFSNKKIEAILDDDDLLLAHCQQNGASDPKSVIDEIHNALWHLAAAPTMREMPEYFIPHPLYRDRSGQYGIWVSKSHRLVIRPDHDDIPNFNWENTRMISKIVVVHICKDYHRKRTERI